MDWWYLRDSSTCTPIPSWRCSPSPEHLAKVAQGVTTEVFGQDGLSYAPVDERALTELRERLRGWNGDPPSVSWAWRSVGEFLSEYDSAGR